MGNNSINLIMPMGGRGSRFGKMGYNQPKPLIEIKGKPFFYWATQSIARFVNLSSLTFVVLQEHIDNFAIDKVIHEYYPQAELVVLLDVLNGAVLTCLEGTKTIANTQPILFNDCDHIFKCRNFYDFCDKGEFTKLDGALLTFASDDPKFSYVAFDEAGNVIRTVEKQVISHDAICGAYYFRNVDIFRQATEKYLDNCSYEEYFVSGVYNEMAAAGQTIKAFQCDMHIPFGTPEEYLEAKDAKKFEELR